MNKSYSDRSITSHNYVLTVQNNFYFQDWKRLQSLLKWSILQSQFLGAWCWRRCSEMSELRPWWYKWGEGGGSADWTDTAFLCWENRRALYSIPMGWATTISHTLPGAAGTHICLCCKRELANLCLELLPHYQSYKAISTQNHFLLWHAQRNFKSEGITMQMFKDVRLFVTYSVD